MTTYKDPLSKYLRENFAVEDRMLKQVRRATPEKGLPAINVEPEEGRFLQFLARASGGKKALEIGTLGGYSGIWIARGLHPNGRLITLEREPEHAEVARAHFAAAGLSERVEVRVGNAHETLATLDNEAPFDFVFIDAEKQGYRAYFGWALEHVQVGGIIAAHNALRGGRVFTTNESDENTEAMRAFNSWVAQDPRVISTIYPAGDGTLVAVRVI